MAPRGPLSLLFSLRTIILTVAATLVVSCTPGGSTNTTSYGSCSGGSGDNSFCLLTCSLGCSLGGCGITNIAQNQPIKLIFSQNVDPNFVNFFEDTKRTLEECDKTLPRFHAFLKVKSSRVSDEVIILTCFLKNFANLRF